MKILLAEDTRDMNRALTAVLSHNGYEVDSVFDGEAALEKLGTDSYDAVILDIMMPKKDGLSVLKEMRARGIVAPVLLLTAKAEVDDRVAGLDAGADDYLTKPFAMKELLARVRSMTRRRNTYQSNELQYQDIRLQADNFELIAENTIRLAAKEFELLQLLILNADHELENTYILEHIWGNEPEADADTVWLYISYLKGKLAAVESRVTIRGMRGGSYQLEA
ncbi:MAG: response regulator transcription factor [Lachnospiraceae bacterium]|nr:response regulator transcription factor [Lachnospiraceae bacterium]